MKLAEALQERADLNRRMEQLKRRLTANALVQEGERPAEEPAELLAELYGCAARLELLMAQINKTNCATLVDGMSLTQLLARKDTLSARLSAYRDLVYAASQTAHRATRGEIRIHSAIDVKATQKQVDQMARELRLLDNRLQGANWATELLEE